MDGRACPISTRLSRNSATFAGAARGYAPRVVRRPLVLMALAAGSAVVAAVVWITAFAVPGGSRIDTAVLFAFFSTATPSLEPRIRGVAVLADVLPFAVIGGVLTAIALARRRPATAVLVPVILFAANMATQLLKPGLAGAWITGLVGIDRGTYPASWPSGHATAAMSLALCAVLVAGPRARGLAAMLGAGYAVAVGYALVALGRHLPSDVLGGYLVAATFVLAGVAALGVLVGRRREPAVGPHGTRAAVAAPALGGLAVVALAAVAVLAWGPDPVRLAVQHGPALATGAGIAALGVAVTAALVAVLRH